MLDAGSVGRRARSIARPITARKRRREQSRRRRQRQRERKSGVSSTRIRRARAKRISPPGEDFSGEPCHRPGCYELFSLPHEHSRKRFCSLECRLALRRVLDRESRYRSARHRRMRCGSKRDEGNRGRRTRRDDVFAHFFLRQARIKVPRPQCGERGAGGRESDFASPVSFLRYWGAWSGTRMDWNESLTRPVTLSELGQRYRQYRLADPDGGGSDGRIATALGPAFAGGGLRCARGSSN